MPTTITTYSHLALYSILLEIWNEELVSYTHQNQIDCLKSKIYAIIKIIESIEHLEAQALIDRYLDLINRLDSS